MVSIVFLALVSHYSRRFCLSEDGVVDILRYAVRVSPATAKFKPEANPNVAGGGSGGQQLEKSKTHSNSASLESCEGGNVKPAPPLVRSMSSPVSAPNNVPSHNNTNINPAAATRKSNSNGSITPDKSYATTPNPEQSQSVQITPQILAQIKELAAEGPKPPPAKEWNLAHIQQMVSLGNFASPPPSSYPASAGAHGNGLLDEAWNHQAQARAILGNLIGPNGEQLTSTDPYNTTVSIDPLIRLIIW